MATIYWQANRQWCRELDDPKGAHLADLRCAAFVLLSYDQYRNKIDPRRGTSLD